MAKIRLEEQALVDSLKSEIIKDLEVKTPDIANDAITKDKINADVAGNGLDQNVDGSLEVKVDGITIQIDTDTLKVVTGAFQVASEKGQPNGYASLDGTGNVPEAQIPDSFNVVNLTPATDNTGFLGTASFRFAEVNATIVNAGDLKFANGWVLTEGDKVGLGDEMILMSPGGKKYRIKLEEVL